MRLFSFLVEQDEVPPRVVLDGRDLGFNSPEPSASCPDTTSSNPGSIRRQTGGAAARNASSGDKGDKANIGVLARHPKYLTLDLGLAQQGSGCYLLRPLT